MLLCDWSSGSGVRGGVSATPCAPLRVMCCPFKGISEISLCDLYLWASTNYFEIRVQVFGICNAKVDTYRGHKALWGECLDIDARRQK